MKCVTLISDFGSRDGSVAAAKAIIMRETEEAMPIIDISHEVEPKLVQQASFILLSNYSFFEEGSCHIILMDVFYAKRPKLVLAEVNKHFFLAPDNGFLSYTFDGEAVNIWQCFELADEQNFQDWLKACARIVKELFTERQALQYPSCALTEAKAAWKPVLYDHMIECHVLHIDRYDNVVLNITRKQIEAAAKGRKFSISFYGHRPIEAVSTRYTDVPIGQPLCRYNHAGFLELSVNGGQAATILGFTIRKEQHLIYTIVKLEFLG